MLFFLLLLMVELSIDMVVLSVFPHPGFKFLACSYSDRECQEGKRVRYRDWESLYLLAVLFRGSKPSRFCQYWDFSNIYWWFWNIFNFFLFFFSFLFLSTFAVAMLWFAFCSVVCCLRVLWFWCLGEITTDPILAFTLLLFSLWKKRGGIIFKARWHFNVLLFLQLSSQVCGFCFWFFVFLSFSDFIILLLVAVSSIFWMLFFWLDDAGWTRGVLILGGVQCVLVFNEDEQTFSLLQVYNVSGWVTRFCIYNKEWGDRNMHLWLTCYFVRAAQIVD